jgi:hypothetical protein
MRKTVLLRQFFENITNFRTFQKLVRKQNCEPHKYNCPFRGEKCALKVTEKKFMCMNYVFAPGKSPVKAQPEILDIFIMGELHVVYMDVGAKSLRVMNVTWTDFDSLALFFIFKTSFGLQVGWFAVSVKQWLHHSVASTAVPTVAVVDSGTIKGIHRPNLEQ